MKLLHNVPAITKAVILAGLMSACQNEKDAVVSPANSLEQVTDANAKTATKLLIKDGDVNLSYYSGRSQLSKETSNIGWLKEYFYGNDNKISCTLSHQQAKINNYAVYTLNEKGLCNQSMIEQSSAQTTYYKYNEMNQLVLAYNKSYPKQRQEYYYEMDPDGQGSSLYSVTFYDKNDVMLKEIFFKYADGTNGGYASLDWHPVNPEPLSQTTSKYLPIFGKFSRYLIKQKIEKIYYVPNGFPAEKEYNYAYTLYSDGSSAIKTIKTTDYFGKVLSNIERKYSAPMTIIQ